LQGLARNKPIGRGKLGGAPYGSTGVPAMILASASPDRKCGSMTWTQGFSHPLGLVGVLVFFALTASAGAQEPLAKARECLLIEPKTKERLDCFDKLFPPRPLRKISVRSIRDCKHIIEEDDRLACYE
jgi:hypothetical protein